LLYSQPTKEKFTLRRCQLSEYFAIFALKVVRDKFVKRQSIRLRGTGDQKQTIYAPKARWKEGLGVERVKGGGGFFSRARQTVV